MDLAAVYALLEGVEKIGEVSGKAVVEAIKAEIKVKNTQEKNLRDRFKAVTTALGLDPESEKLEVDAKVLKGKADAGGAGSTELESLRRSVAELTTKSETAETRAQTEQAAREESDKRSALLRKKSALQSELVKLKVKRPELSIAVLTDLVEAETAADGTEILHLKVGNAKKPLAEGLKTWLADKADLIENNGRPGSGSTPVEPRRVDGNGGGDGEVLNPRAMLKRGLAEKTT